FAQARDQLQADARITATGADACHARVDRTDLFGTHAVARVVDDDRGILLQAHVDTAVVAVLDGIAQQVSHRGADDARRRLDLARWRRRQAQLHRLACGQVLVVV